MSTTTTEGHPVAQPPVVPAFTVADPAPLGLAAFAMTTFALSLSNAHVWIAGSNAAVSLALAYGGGIQLLAGMWEFKRNNTFGALAFSSFGAFWIAFWYLNIHIVPALLLHPVTALTIPVTVGVFLLGWTIFTAYMTVASLRVSVAVAIVFVLLTLTFVALTIGAFHSSVGWNKLGGWLGIATAAAAWYASFAGVVNSTFQRTLLPVRSLAV
jgi:hypothetical protein